ncbi:MAG: hypothetical protein ACRCXT_03890 [Paraclostridium sp.]
MYKQKLRKYPLILEFKFGRNIHSIDLTTNEQDISLQEKIDFELESVWGAYEGEYKGYKLYRFGRLEDEVLVQKCNHCKNRYQIEGDDIQL